VDLGAFISGITTVDLLLFLYFAGFFVLGFAQGTIRRLIGIGSILFSFYFAANVADPLGVFLGANWTQFPKQYSFMVGFGTIFVSAALAFALVAQGFYKPQPLFEKARFADELLGGFLGLIQAAIILGAVIVILGTFFLIPGIPQSPRELPLLRELWVALDTSTIAHGFRDTIIPAVIGLTSFLVPDSIRQFFPSPSA
jgi:uncharacterized membrane protein required for colicin V production